MLKNVIFLLSLLVFGSRVKAQSNSIDPNEAGNSIAKSLTLPTVKEVGKKEVKGIYLFTVELDGTVKNIKVKDSIGYGIDEQIITQLSKATGWKVAEMGGKPIRIQYRLPLAIKLPK